MRTRIVKGTYTKISGGGHSMFSKEDIITSASIAVTETGSKDGVSYGMPKLPPMAPQPIKIVVHFRPHKDWKGEFGFDWFREGDTMLFNDNKFNDIVAYQYEDSAFNAKVMDINKYSGFFKADETMCNALKREYKAFCIPWKTRKNKAGIETVDEYLVPWLSIRKDKEVKITFFAEIEEAVDYLEFKSSEYFIFTPNKIQIKGKKKVMLDEHTVTIKCIKEFSNDQTIRLNAFKKDKSINLEAWAGTISVWANDTSKQKQKDVVFVEIKTPAISSKKEEKPNVENEKERINQYLEQAYIKLSDNSDVVEMDLTTEKDFIDFVTTNQIDNAKKSKGKTLVRYLREKLGEIYTDKYKDHFKAFYFAEDGHSSTGGLLSGFSALGADYVVVFKSKNDQTAAHEFLHSMNLPHTFTNKAASADALFTYQYRKTDNLLDYSHHGGNYNRRCSLFYWQWKKANNSIK